MTATPNNGYSLVMSASLHSLADERSLALHRAVAERLGNDPSLLARAVARVAAWSEDPIRHPYAADWRALLTGSLDELRSALVSTEPTMCTLRQASPFAGALDAKTRWEILKQPALRSRETR